jgi:4-hydroxybenzoate polyprenyltransferase
MNSIKNYLILARLHKPIGIVLLLWPTLWALWIASHGMPALQPLLIFTAGVIIMRTAGCIMNDIADRNFDGAVARTQQRPLATGAIRLKGALIFLCLLLLSALGLVLMLNRFTQMMAIPALVLAACYPLMKRFTHLPQLVLGCAFSWGILMVFTAIQHRIPLIAWLLFLSNVIWAVVYDSEYAMVDRDDDKAIGIKSTAILFGQHDRLIIGALQCVLLALWAGCGMILHFQHAYFVALIFIAGFFVYQQSLIFTRSKEGCFNAFLNNNWVGLMLFIGILVQ